MQVQIATIDRNKLFLARSANALVTVIADDGVVTDYRVRFWLTRADILAFGQAYTVRTLPISGVTCSVPVDLPAGLVSSTEWLDALDLALSDQRSHSAKAEG